MSSNPRHVAVAPIMGTTVSIHVIGRVDPAVFESAADGCFDELRRLERIFSPYRVDSELLRLRRGELTLAEADPVHAEVREGCAQAERDTAGLFSSTFDGAYDPTGFVKGWAVERAGRMHLEPLLALPGVVAAGVNAGGDMQLFTAPGSDWLWNVGIVDPADRGRTIATVSVRDGAVATSGLAERGAHIIDPRTGAPTSAVASATVVSNSLAHADVWATAAVVAGFDELSWIARAGRTTGMVVSVTGAARRWIDGIEIQTAVAPPEVEDQRDQPDDRAADRQGHPPGHRDQEPEEAEPRTQKEDATGHQIESPRMTTSDPPSMKMT